MSSVPLPFLTRSESRLAVFFPLPERWTYMEFIPTEWSSIWSSSNDKSDQPPDVRPPFR